MIKDFKDLEKSLQGRQGKRRLLVVSAHDVDTLKGVHLAIERGLVEPILLGREDLIRKAMDKVAAKGEAMVFPRESIVHCSDDENAARAAVEMIRSGQGDAIMKGSCRTADLLRQVIHRETGIRKSRVMSHVGVFQVPGYHKPVAMTDGGMIPHPNLEEKKALIENAAEVVRKLGCSLPKVACLAAGEDVNPKAPETLHGAELKEMNRKGEISGCIVEGPISYDLAVSKEIAERKGYRSPVAGDADILLAPDMATGNILAKSWTVSCSGVMAGIVVGAEVPIVLVSRGASTEEKYLSIVLAVAATL